MATKKKSSVKKGLGMLAGAAIVGAVGYALLGKNGATNRNKVKGWVVMAKGEVMHEIETIKKMDLSEKDYNKIVDKVMKKYKKLKDINSKEALALGKELQGYWKEIEKRGKKKPVKKSVKPRKKAVTSKKKA